MAAGNTYVALATQTLGSAAASVTFSSISGSYTDLILVATVAAVNGADNVKIQFNGDTTTNYSTTMLSGTGSAANSSRWSNESSIRTDYYGYPPTTLSSNKIIQINNYSNTTTYKTAIIRNNAAAQGVETAVGLWRSTSAVSSIVITWSLNFITGSTFTLYGIAAA